MNPEFSVSSTNLVVAVLDAICHDAEARRELLWLRAASKHDLDALADLEDCDPHIRTRLACLVARGWLWRRRRGLSASWRSFYDQLYDERYRHHTARLLDQACRCVECAQDEMDALAS